MSQCSFICHSRDISESNLCCFYHLSLSFWVAPHKFRNIFKNSAKSSPPNLSRFIIYRHAACSLSLLFSQVFRLSRRQNEDQTQHQLKRHKIAGVSEQSTNWILRPQGKNGTRRGLLHIHQASRRGIKWREVGENCIMRSFITCTLLQV
jgi:hypothetical protein